jgi:hypothetical protein
LEWRPYSCQEVIWSTNNRKPRTRCCKLCGDLSQSISVLGSRSSCICSGSITAM